MEELIEALIIEIKKDNRYISFFNSEEKLKEAKLQALLSKYQDAQNEYQELKKYDQHIDLSKHVDDLKHLKKEVSENLIIKEYYASYHALNDLLDEITKIVYTNISKELDLSKYKL